MLEINVSALVPPQDMDLTDLVARAAEEAPDAVLFSRRSTAGALEDVTSRAFLAEVTRLAKGLVAAGVRPGDRVGLMAKTRYEWTLTDFAIWFAGGVTVPIYETSSAEQVAWILSNSRAVGAVVETAAHAATVESVRAGLPALTCLWTIDAGALDELARSGQEVPDDEIDARRAALRSDTVATIIYTSGTTGRPKGCELTHANFVDLAENAVAEMALVVRAEGASTLLFLPLAHVFARFIQVLCVAARCRMGHSPDVKNLLDDLGAFRPTFVLAVPRVFEKIYNSAEATAQAAGRGRIFAMAADTAIEWSQAHDTGGPGLVLRAKHALFDRLVYGKLRERLGGQVQYAVSGGAPLGARLGHFFRGVGVVVLEGWGLTETTAPATVNTPEQIKIGTVGRPLPGVAVRTGDDGELLVRGVNVMRGYFDNPEATAEALEGGWFHTGDLGEIDDDGFVRITGRKKEIIVTAGGKNVAPTLLEDRLRSNALVSQTMVVGDQRPFIAALVTLDPEMLPGWLATHGKPPMGVQAAAQDPDVRAEIQRAVDAANQAVSKAESIRKFVILDTDFTEAGGHLTPKLSLRRAVVQKEFAQQIESLYT
ncbi:MAG TPA: AMP-dependent synthetase/ligase [Kineosporiaceae bacterium]|nr:AMP-dependent synthetase/ligase [Kineosporiaceae bacterium]